LLKSISKASSLVAFRRGPALTLAFLIGSFAGFSLARAVEVPPDAEHESVQRFGLQASAFLKKHCTDCHGSNTQEAELRFDDLPLDFTNADTTLIWRRVLEQVLFAEMPPRDSDPLPSTTERSDFVALVEGRLSDLGQGLNLDEKMLLPEYGNFVDHELLFNGTIQDLPYTPSRLWRQRPDIYRQMWGKHYGQQHRFSVKIGGTEREGDLHTVQRGPHKGKPIAGRYFAKEGFANPFYEYVHHASGFTDYATIVADQASLEALVNNAETMAEILTLGMSVTITTEVKSKDSQPGNNHGGFVGGVETISHERRGKIPLSFKRIIGTEGAVAREDFAAALRVIFNLFLRRSPNTEDIEHYWSDVFLKNSDLGNTMALQSVLIFVAISPEFVYRMEMGLGPEDEFGRRMLSPHELVFALHYALDNTPAFGVDEFEDEEVYTKNSEPLVKQMMTDQKEVRYSRDGWLAEQMKSGGLRTPADVKAALQQMLGGDSGNLHPNHNKTIDTVKNPRILQFFREFFGYHKAETVFKDVDKFAKEKDFAHFHNHSAVRYMYDTDALILHILQKDQNVLEELLTTNKVFVSYWAGMNDEASIRRAGGRANFIATHDAQSYNISPLEHDHSRHEPFEVPPEQRCGILTQPSWLVAHSGNFDNDPVRRGKWIREKLLGGTVLDVPITVDAQIPDDDTKTLRERFSVVQAESCWRCHRKMNPLGMPFEAFNHVGRYRTLEQGKPVDTTGEISFSEVPGLDGAVKNVREMMERLAKSPRVRQSFLRHMFRYWMGRNEMLSDSRTLVAMDDTYVSTGGSFKETLITLLTSDSFLYRK